MGKVFCLYHRVASSMSTNPAAEVCALCDPPPHISFTWLVAHMFFPFLFAHTHSYIFFGGTERLWNSHSLSLNIPEMLEGTVASVVGRSYVTRRGKEHKCYELYGNRWSWSENNLITASTPFEESDFESILL